MTAEGAFQAFCRAFEARNAEAVLSLFDENGFYEMPLLGQRLVGAGEIDAGFQRIFSLVERCAIEPRIIKSLSTTTIAEGRLSAKLHRDSNPLDLPCAIVLRTRAGKISRLSTYLDARPYRLWADGPILAAERQV
jgi:ketosteroid isomerase-like protein